MAPERIYLFLSKGGQCNRHTHAPKKPQTNQNQLPSLRLFHWKLLMLLKRTLCRALPTALTSRNRKHTLFQFFRYCHLTFDALLHSPGAFYHERHKKRLQLSPLMPELGRRWHSQEHQLWTTRDLPGWLRDCFCTEMRTLPSFSATSSSRSLVFPTPVANTTPLKPQCSVLVELLHCGSKQPFALREKDAALAYSPYRIPCGQPGNAWGDNKLADAFEQAAIKTTEMQTSNKSQRSGKSFLGGFWWIKHCQLEPKHLAFLLNYPGHL